MAEGLVEEFNALFSGEFELEKYFIGIFRTAQ